MAAGFIWRPLPKVTVSLDDTSVTEWRLHDEALENLRKLVSLDDTSVTEWRQKWI